MADIVRRLRNPPFGTETSERNLMTAAADEIERLRDLCGSLLAQFDHAGCTCTFQSDDCCAYAKARAALAQGQAS